MMRRAPRRAVIGDVLVAQLRADGAVTVPDRVTAVRRAPTIAIVVGGLGALVALYGLAVDVALVRGIGLLGVAAAVVLVISMTLRANELRFGMRLTRTGLTVLPGSEIAWDDIVGTRLHAIPIRRFIVLQVAAVDLDVAALERVAHALPIGFADRIDRTESDAIMMLPTTLVIDTDELVALVEVARTLDAA